MPPTNTEIREYVRNARFKELFLKLGWDNVPASQKFRISLQERNFDFQPIAHKRGFVVLLHESPSADSIPDRAAGLKIENKLTPLAAEHLIIFTDRERTRQVWQWSRRVAGAPTRISRETYFAGATGERIAQRLGGLFISLEDEEGLTITDVSRRAEAGFREKVTKRFFDKFKAEHEKFSKDVEGIVDAVERDRFASLTLNRLMFVYFVQSKGFLNDDKGYLRTKLNETRNKVGRDMFYEFYETFLARFFHEGLGESDRPPELVALIGKVPYLNGGLFERHSVEVENTIEIKDEAFEKIFNFFDDYDWHLDDRPLKDDRQINPEVLGYIFEKFINQKQMGAYYTKEDITEYISKNTVIPFLFDRVKEKVKIAFHERDGLWKILREDPDRYIYDAVRKGVIDDEGNMIDVPAEVAAGIDDVSKRTGWNRTADEEFGLPTETWREYIARRQRCLEIREKLTKGEIHDINDLITYNLDIRRFAEDVIFTAESADLVKAFYHAIAGRIPERSNERFEYGISILDPTCGSGAFLFAALKILEPLLSACLDRIEDFVEDEDQLRPGSKKFAPFRRVLDEIEKHPNRKYFILKSIIVNNLFGVDIMPDAVEICKLRLFLTLVAEVDPDPGHQNLGLEPLPDIDFNIRSGNTLVGFATEKQVYEAFQGAEQGRFAFDSRADDFKWRAEQTASKYEQFRLQQVKEGGEISHEDKNSLAQELRTLSDELDIYIAHEYGIRETEEKKYTQFLASHQPFHWYSEFYSIIANGGFDVIIGNPPYVEYAKIRNIYRVQNYRTESCGNLYAFCWERCSQITGAESRIGMIVPVASVCTSGYQPLQELLTSEGTPVISNFNDRPSKLFDGLEHIRLSIILLNKSRKRDVFSSTYYKWNAEERSQLFQLLSFVENKDVNLVGAIAKFGFPIEKQILRKLNSNSKGIGEIAVRNSSQSIFYTRKLSNFVQILNFVPSITDLRGNARLPTELKQINFPSPESRDAFLALLNSTLFYWLLKAYSDCRNLNKREILLPKFDVSKASDRTLQDLSRMSTKLMEEILESSEVRRMGKLCIQCTFPKNSKSTIDAIDKVLGAHYGFTVEELDFIINYHIKYRMGAEED